MKKINYLSLFILILITLTTSNKLSAEIIILSSCNNQKDGFLKNEYILDLEKSLMKRNYIYDSKTFKKYKSTDLSVKQENLIERFIYEDENLILTDKIGYPQFYTQLVFEKINH